MRNDCSLNDQPAGDPILGPSLFSTVASPHTSLGLLAYSQATSPIRRYGDLLVHQQIKAALRSTSHINHTPLVLINADDTQPYSTADLVAAMNDVSHTTMVRDRCALTLCTGSRSLSVQSVWRS